MASTEQQPTRQLKLPTPEIADDGKVRLGCGLITGDFPAVRMPKREIADDGKVRLGCGLITGDFPVRG